MSQTPDFVQQQRDCRFLTEVVRAALKQTAPPPPCRKTVIGPAFTTPPGSIVWRG